MRKFLGCLAIIGLVVTGCGTEGERMGIQQTPFGGPAEPTPPATTPARLEQPPSSQPAGPEAAPASHAEKAEPLDLAMIEPFAELALQCIHKEYPNKIAHVMNSDAEAKPPHEL